MTNVQPGSIYEPRGGWGNNQAVVESVNGDKVTLRIEAKPGTQFDHLPPCWTEVTLQALTEGYTLTSEPLDAGFPYSDNVVIRTRGNAFTVETCEGANMLGTTFTTFALAEEAARLHVWG